MSDDLLDLICMQLLAAGEALKKAGKTLKGAQPPGRTVGTKWPRSK